MKKAMLPMNAFIILLLVLLVTGPLIASNMKIGQNIDDSSRIEACSLSIISAAESKRFPIKAGEPRTMISCERGETIIKYEDIIVGKEIDQAALDRIISDLLKETWDAAAQGKYDPFPDYEGSDDSQFKSACIMWEKIRFDSKLKKYLDNNNKDLYFSFDTLYDLEISAGKTYGEYLFNKESLPANIDKKIVKIDEGTVIFAKQYRGNLINFWNPLRLIYYFGKRCKDCSYLWTLDILPSHKSFSDEDIEVEGKKYRICDQIKN